MTQNPTQHTHGRRSWLSLIGVAAAALAIRPAAAEAQAPGAGGRFQPARHTEDAWFDALPGKHRTIIDSFSVKGGGDALLFANNLFVANASGYKLTDADVAVVVTLRHSSTAFAFTDKIWAKYSKGLTQGLTLTDPKSGQVPTFNLYNAQGYGTQLPNYGQTIDAVAKRGVHFAVCQMATRRLAGQVAMVHGSTADAIYAELTANLVPNGHMVAAGVIAVTRAQEYGYTVLSAG